ncbi:polygalacturonase QRT3-like [Ziziphus jujuba]|uniref:Polygalacturonase QRT3-like n=1 Tax=Ziziphus jujuba TaxID=326968 RepID=A0ABM3ZVZ1_ZIZJJ|nr:polygalacturonase QRT3-like [Ziziphus jujuba]
MRKMEAFKASLIRGRRDFVVSSSSAPPQPPKGTGNGAGRVYYMSDFGGDPTGQKDSTEHIQSLLDAAAAQAPSAQSVLSSAGSGPSEGSLTAGVPNKAGTADLQGGTYKVSKPVQVPPGGNIVIKDGTIQASDDSPEGGPAIDASPKQAPPAENTESFVDDIKPAQLSPDPSSFSFEYITFQNIMIDSNHRGAGISLSNALRTSIENVYVSHFSTTAINVQPSSSETYITNSFLGQHPTAGRDPHERNFTGTAINLSGTNNALTDVVLFSSAVGVDVSGHGNTLSGVHCYNKATRFGATGIYLRKLGQDVGRNRIINCYLDYSRIVAEDPLQLHISNSFFRGDAFVALKSIKGVVSGVNIVDNTFSGSNKGTGIVQLQQSNGPFNKINQVVVDRNSVTGMSMKATVANGAVRGNGTSFTLDFNPVLLFPNRITHAQYSLIATNGAFPNHVLRSVSNNRVVVATNVPVSATVFATVDQN